MLMDNCNASVREIEGKDGRFLCLCVDGRPLNCQMSLFVESGMDCDYATVVCRLGPDAMPEKELAQDA